MTASLPSTASRTPRGAFPGRKPGIRLRCERWRTASVMAASRRSGGSSIRTLRALFGAGVTVTFITSSIGWEVGGTRRGLDARPALLGVGGLAFVVGAVRALGELVLALARREAIPELRLHAVGLLLRPAGMLLADDLPAARPWRLAGGSKRGAVDREDLDVGRVLGDLALDLDGLADVLVERVGTFVEEPLRPRLEGVALASVRQGVSGLGLAVLVRLARGLLDRAVERDRDLRRLVLLLARSVLLAGPGAGQNRHGDEQQERDPH